MISFCFTHIYTVHLQTICMMFICDSCKARISVGIVSKHIKPCTDWKLWDDYSWFSSIPGVKDFKKIPALRVWNFFCKIMFIRSFYDKINIIRRAFYYGKTKETCTQSTNDRKRQILRLPLNITPLLWAAWFPAFLGKLLCPGHQMVQFCRIYISFFIAQLRQPVRICLK